MSDFAATISEAYATEGAAIDLGRGVHDGKLVNDAVVHVALRMMNRHGLIAGATGTGTTITLQTIVEQLSDAGVAVFAADVKGDVSGIGAPGEPGGPAEKRMGELGLAFEPRGYLVEYLSLGGIGPGVPVCATVSDFGPQLLAKILDANETQEQSLALVFHYAEAKGLPRLDPRPSARMEDRDGSEPVAKEPHRRKREPDAATVHTGGADALGEFLGSREGKALQKKVMRGVFGMLRKRL